MILCTVAGIVGICMFIGLVELLVRVADRIGITDKLFGVFDLTTKSNVIYVDFNRDERRNHHG